MYRPNFWLAGFCATGCLTLLALLSATAADSPSKPIHSGDLSQGGASSEELRLREGLELEDEIGEFRDAGARISFYPSDGNMTLTVLENLALERVYGELERRSGRRQWSVSGVITEYRGGNYLRITRAVMKPKASGAREPTRGATPDSSDTQGS